MRGTSEGFEREDALVCADVLGGFGVSSDHVREHVADADGLESAIQRALADPEHPTAFVRRTVAAAPRGVDAPVRYWTTAPETQLGDVFAALDWTFDVKSANGRSLSVDDEQPYRLRVEDADGRTRSTDFSFPESPLGDDNYPALVATINEELLYGLSCRFVQLSDGTDRWRFALVETAELDRLREQFGERLSVFDRPLLAAAQPDAYHPGIDLESSEADEVPVPDWACEDDERSWRGRRVTADAFDADHVGGLDHLDEPDGVADDDGHAAGSDDAGSDEETDTDGRGATAAVIEFAEVDGDGDSTDGDGGMDGSASGVSSGTGASTVVRDADAEADAGDDLDAWSIGGTVDATTRSSGNATGNSASSTDDASTASAEGTASTEDTASVEVTAVTAGDDAESAGSDISVSGFEWGDDEDAAANDAGLAGVDDGDDGDCGAGTNTNVSGETESDDDGFFSTHAASSFDAGSKTSRVEGDSFGVDAGEQTEDDQFAAVGVALAAPESISVGGLLDDEEFLPHLPQSEPEQTRIEFDEEFDPDAGPSAQERETDDGFVWVNESGGLDEQRTSALD